MDAYDRGPYPISASSDGTYIVSGHDKGVVRIHRVARTPSNGNDSDSDGSADSDEGDDGRDLLEQKWMDDEL